MNLAPHVWRCGRDGGCGRLLAGVLRGGQVAGLGNALGAVVCGFAKHFPRAGDVVLAPALCVGRELPHVLVVSVSVVDARG